MARSPRNCRARRGACEIQSGQSRRNPGRARAADGAGPDGRLVQSDCHPFGRLAATGGSRMTVTYRDATVKDAAELDRIFDRSFCDTFAHLYRSEDLDSFLSGFGV